MAKHTIDLTSEQEAGVTHARALANASRAADDRFPTNTAYVQFVMSGAADSYAKSKAANDDPQAVIAAKDAEISNLKSQLEAKETK